MQKEEVWNTMRDREILCVCAAFFVFVFRGPYSFFGRSTLRVIFLILGAPSLRNAPGSQKTRVGYRRCLSEMGLPAIRAPMGLRVWSCGTEALRILDDWRWSFQVRTFNSWNLFERVTNYDFFTKQR